LLGSKLTQQWDPVNDPVVGGHGGFVFEKDTPWKFNIAPENGWLEDEFPFGIPYFQVLC